MGNLELKGKLAELKQQKMQLAVSANAKIRAMKSLLSTAMIEPLDQINTDEIEALAKELAKANREYCDILRHIAVIEKELD